MNTAVIKGTMLKMAIGFQYQGEQVTLDDIDFSTEWYTQTAKVVLRKEDYIVEEGDYYAYIDTDKVGKGFLKMRMTAYIPDGHIEGGIRKEIAECSTNVSIQ